MPEMTPEAIKRLQAIFEAEVKAKHSCTGCFRLPTKDAPTYDMDCGECSRFYADMYATAEIEE